MRRFRSNVIFEADVIKDLDPDHCQVLGEVDTYRVQPEFFAMPARPGDYIVRFSDGTGYLPVDGAGFRSAYVEVTN